MLSDRWCAGIQRPIKHFNLSSKSIKAFFGKKSRFCAFSRVCASFQLFVWRYFSANIGSGVMSGTKIFDFINNQKPNCTKLIWWSGLLHQYDVFICTSAWVQVRPSALLFYDRYLCYSMIATTKLCKYKYKNRIWFLAWFRQVLWTHQLSMSSW